MRIKIQNPKFKILNSISSVRSFLRDEWWLVGVLVVAAGLRWWLLPDNLFFGWEQGRDLLAVRQLLSGKLSLIGPKTDFPGVFHGALSYWLLAVPFVVFGGNPLGIMAVLMGVNLMGLVLFYKAISSLWGRRVGVVSVVLAAGSYVSVVYARWLSNPNVVPGLVMGLFWVLVAAKKERRFLAVAAGLWGVMWHLQAAVAVTILLAVGLWMWREKIALRWREMLLSGVVLGVLFLPYAAFEVRHEFLMSKGAVNMVKGIGGGGDRGGVVQVWLDEALDGVWPGKRDLGLVVLAAVIGLAVGVGLKERKFLGVVGFWAAPVVFFLVLGMRPLRHYLMGMHVFFPLLVAMIVGRLVKMGKGWVGYGLAGIVLIGNLGAIYARLPENVGIFLHHSQRTYLGDEERLIDWVYGEAGGEPFSYDYYSVPYWKREAWEYLFSWYGKGSYGYLPGEERTKVLYVLIEPDERQPKFQKDWYAGMERESELLTAYKSGKLWVEKRAVR